MSGSLRVLMVTSDWPTPGKPRTTNFIKRQADFLSAAGVAVDVFAFSGSKRPANYLRAWWQLRRRLRNTRYDLIHAQFGQSGVLAFPKRLPLVVTLRGSDILGIVSDADGRHTALGRMLTSLTRWVADRADAVIVVSDHMKAHLRRSRSAHVIPSGLDLELFRPIPMQEARQKLGLSLDKRLVLFAGRPHQARKRYELARAAVDALNARRAEGSQPVELVVAWGVWYTDMPLYMNACDALVFTSMQEGSPNVVKEALACNLPVVSVAVGDVEERLAGVANCALVPDGSPAEQVPALTAGLERVLADGRRSDGRAHVAHLDETLLTQRVIGIYRSILPGAAPATARPAAPLTRATPVSDARRERPLGTPDGTRVPVPPHGCGVGATPVAERGLEDGVQVSTSTSFNASHGG